MRNRKVDEEKLLMSKVNFIMSEGRKKLMIIDGRKLGDVMPAVQPIKIEMQCAGTVEGIK